MRIAASNKSKALSRETDIRLLKMHSNRVRRRSQTHSYANLSPGYN